MKHPNDMVKMDILGPFYLNKSSGRNYIISCLDNCSNMYVTINHEGTRCKLFKSSETFELQGNRYHYIFDAYCPTWKNERAAIIPIAWELVQKYRLDKKEVLEIGNMLSYVFKVDHDIIDIIAKLSPMSGSTTFSYTTNVVLQNTILKKDTLDKEMMVGMYAL